MTLTPGRYVFCERGRTMDMCRGVEGIRIDSTDATLEGYQIYLVEQWAITRNREVATAVSFTGDPVHRIQVVVITIESSEVSCPRLEKVFDKLRTAGARPKETPYGYLFVTNLSLFQSTLNIVLVPNDGDFDSNLRAFYLNLNLRRMGCSGRSALTSKPPSGAQKEKFNQLYRISEGSELKDTVIPLVELVQNCLFIFGLFKLADVDGLLCDATEEGLKSFCNSFLDKRQPLHDNVLDPSVLAAMFSKLSNIRGKLQHLINNVPKDPFAEPTSFLNAVKAFQYKRSDLEVCYLNVKTVEAITIAYQSSFNPQGLKVHKVLKHKIEDFSGMTAVNPEGETTDLEVFAKHIHSESLKQVWKGKTKMKADMADALANGDWLTGGKELGKSLVRGLAKTTRETKSASQSLKSIAAGKNRQSFLQPKGKGSPITNMKDGVMTDETPVTSGAQPEFIPLKSDDDKAGFEGGYESEEIPPAYVTPAVGLVSEEETPNSVVEATAPPTAAIPSVDILTSLFSEKPPPVGPPEITAFRLDRRASPFGGHIPPASSSSLQTSASFSSALAAATAALATAAIAPSTAAISTAGSTAGAGGSGSSTSSSLQPARKRSQSMTGLAGQERVLGCRLESARSLGAIPGIGFGPFRKIAKHPAYRKRSRSVADLVCRDGIKVKPLRSVVIECDTQNYYSYQLLKEKEESLKGLYERMQAIEEDFSSQLESLKKILAERGKEFEEMDQEAGAILAARRELLTEVRDKEHATQRSVYHLEGMVGKLIEMRDFTGAFFNKISYLDTKLPVSQRRLALWMDKLQALQSQWFRTIGRYMIVYAPNGIRNRFVEWERDVQSAAQRARELRGEVSEIQLGGGSAALAAAAASAAATVATRYKATSPTVVAANRLPTSTSSRSSSSSASSSSSSSSSAATGTAGMTEARSSSLCDGLVSLGSRVEASESSMSDGLQTHSPGLIYPEDLRQHGDRFIAPERSSRIRARSSVHNGTRTGLATAATTTRNSTSASGAATAALDSPLMGLGGSSSSSGG